MGTTLGIHAAQQQYDTALKQHETALSTGLTGMRRTDGRSNVSFSDAIILEERGYTYIGA